MSTHTMNYLKLSSETLTDVAWGFVSRSQMVFLGGLTPDEMGTLRPCLACRTRRSLGSRTGPMTQMGEWHRTPPIRGSSSSDG